MYLIIKDYQIIMEVVYNEAPTSLAYSSNKKSAVIYISFVTVQNIHFCQGQP